MLFVWDLMYLCVTRHGRIANSLGYQLNLAIDFELHPLFLYQNQFFPLQSRFKLALLFISEMLKQTRDLDGPIMPLAVY